MTSVCSINLQKNGALLFGRNSDQKIVNRIFRYLSLHEAVPNLIVCYSFLKASDNLHKILERKFGTIMVVDHTIYVSKRIARRHRHYFVNYRHVGYFDILVSKANRMVRIESLLFIQKMDGEWLSILPEGRGKVNRFGFEFVYPARLDYYVARFIFDNNAGLMFINTESCTEYLYYDSVVVHDDRRVYTKKLKNGITRNVVCCFGKDHKKIETFVDNVQPGLVRNLTEKQMTDMLFLVDADNSRAIMGDINSTIFFLGPNMVVDIPMANKYKDRRTKCLNK